jgi:glycosyltransferase involved in cell wall biosynthesis
MFGTMRENRVLILPWWYPNQKSKYDGNFVQNHALAASKYADIQVLFCTSGNDSDYIINLQVRPKLRETIVYFPNHPWKVVRFIRKLKAFYKGYKTLNQYDILQTHVFFWAGILGVLLAFCVKKPLIHIEHSSQFHKLSGWRKRLFKYLQLRVDVFKMESQDLCKTAKNYGVGEDRIALIATPVDADHFVRKNIANSNETFRFLHISKMDDPRKNVKGILSVVKRLSNEYENFIFEIGGDGNIEMVKSWAAELQISDKYLEMQRKYKYKELPFVYSQADCFVLFSEFENFGVVLAEAMLCGTPTIGSRVGGIKDFINSKNGYLISPSNEEELYEAMKSMLLKLKNFDPIMVRESVLDYLSYDAVGQQMNDLYNRIMKRLR